MSLPETGVRLVAENEAGFTRALGSADDAVERFGQGADGATTGTIAFGTAIGNLATGAITAVGGLLLDAGQAAGAFLGDSIMKAADLEAQMSGVGAVLGVNKDELQELKDLVVDLGIDPTLKVSATEAAGAIEMLAQNGLSMEQIMDGAARATIFLSNATGGDFVLSAALMTDAASIFNIEGEHMMDVVDGVAGVANASKFGIEDYALALANGGAVAASSGVEFADFNTVIAGIAPQFSSGQTAGTAFKNLLLRLTPASAPAAEAMEELGLITEDGSNAFYDAEGNLRSMSEVTGILENALSGLSEEQRTSYLRTIFGNDAMGAAIGLAELGQEEFDALAASMAEVDSGEAAAMRVDNFAGKLDILKGVVEAVQLKIGDYFLPVLTTLAEKISEFVDNNADGFIAFFEKGATFVETFVTGLFDGQGVIDSFIAALATLGVDQATIDTIQSVADTIGSVISAIVTFVSEHSDAFMGAIIGIGAALTGAGIVAAISAVGAVIAGIGVPVLAVIALAGLLGAAWAENWFGIRDKTQAVIDFITPIIQTALTNIQTWWAENGDTIIAAVTNAYNFISTTIQTALTAIQTWWAENGAAITTDATTTYTTIQTAIETAINFISTTIQTVLTGIQTWWSEHGTSVMTIVTTLYEGIKTGIETAITTIQTIIDTVLTAIGDFWDAHGTAISESAGLAWEAIQTVVETVTSAIGDVIDAFAAAIEGDWTAFGENLREAWDTLWEGINTALDTWDDAILTTVQSLIDGIIAWFEETDWGQVGSDIIQGIADGIASATQFIVDAAEAAAQAALDAAKGFLGIESPSKEAAKQIGRPFVQGVELGVDEELPFLKRGMLTIADDMLQSAIRPVASADQISRQCVNNAMTDRSLTVNYESNNSWRPVADRDELMYLLGAYAN